MRPASCHTRVDPLGYGPENFDAVDAWGVVWASGMLLREAFRQFIELFPAPLLTNVAAGKIAAAGTNALGRSAQAYFFRGEVALLKSSTP